LPLGAALPEGAKLKTLTPTPLPSQKALRERGFLSWSWFEGERPIG